MPESDRDDTVERVARCGARLARIDLPALLARCEDADLRRVVAGHVEMHQVHAEALAQLGGEARELRGLVETMRAQLGILAAPAIDCGPFPPPGHE
jgi:hypothetical protein